MPKRAYPSTSVVEPPFQGTFEYYVASVINHWMTSDDDRVTELTRVLGIQGLGLTAGIGIRQIGATAIEILVHRRVDGTVFSPGGMVNIADVGLGVSQVLPVLVALLVARPGQLVYLEQPEIHLHPRAQVALANILADAANRGVRIVAETHSALLIQGIQTLVAEGEITPDKVMLHWFNRSRNGSTKIDSRELDEFGAYGDWPEDFADVQMDTDSAYLDAVEQRELEKLHDGQKSEMSGG